MGLGDGGSCGGSLRSKVRGESEYQDAQEVIPKGVDWGRGLNNGIRVFEIHSSIWASVRAIVSPFQGFLVLLAR